MVRFPAWRKLVIRTKFMLRLAKTPCSVSFSFNLASLSVSLVTQSRKTLECVLHIILTRRRICKPPIDCVKSWTKLHKT